MSDKAGERHVAIIQARMGSKRLPGKVLADIAGEPMLARVVERTRRAERLDETVVATTTAESDGRIVSLCQQRGWPCFRGQENDVLDRYYRTAMEWRAGVVIRITSDCPLIDPELIDALLDFYAQHRPDYASISPTNFPRGLDCEVMSWAALEAAWKLAREAYQRVHVTPYIYEHPERFRIIEFAHAPGEERGRQLRWTVDTAEDLEFVRAIYAKLGGEATFGWRNVLALIDREPALRNINTHICQKSLQEC